MQTILMWAAIIFLLDLLLIAFVRGADERRDRKEQCRCRANRDAEPNRTLRQGTSNINQVGA